MPDIFFETLDLVPEEFRDSIKQENGKIVVNVVLKTKLDEFRDNNTKLAQERDTLKAKADTLSQVVGEDAEAFATELVELREVAQKVKDGKLKGDDTIAKEVENRIGAMRGQYEDQLKAAGKETNAWKDKAVQADNKFKRSQVGAAVTNAVIAAESGVEPKALPDILERAFKTFQVQDDGNLIAKEGDVTIYGGDGSTPLTVNEWVSKLKDTAPYFFKQSSGGGAGGNGNGSRPAGMSEAEFQKLPPQQRLEMAHRFKLG